MISNFSGYGPNLPGAAPLPVLRTLSRELAPEEATRNAAAELLQSGPDWLVLPEPYYARFLNDREAFPEKAKFFGAFLDGEAGYVFAARFRQSPFWRPPNEFLDPEILVFRRAP